MTNKSDDTKAIERWLRSSHYWQNGESFYVVMAFNLMTKTSACKHVNRRQVQTVIHAMHKRGELEKYGQMKYRRKSETRAWLTRSWRKCSNADLGISPNQFGVPV